MESSLIETLVAVWRESLSLLIIISLGFFAHNRMKRVDELSDARLKDAMETLQAMSEIERETIRSIDSLKTIIMAQKGG